MKNLNQSSEVLSNLYLSSNVAVELSAKDVNRVYIPFTDFILDDYLKENCLLSAVNYTVNNVATYYCQQYGGPEKITYDISIVIPTSVDNSNSSFNEFYINFLLCKNADLSVKFFLNADLKCPINGIPEYLSSNHTFHFYENKKNEYLIEWGENVNKIS